jgi:hypothetical protein
MRYATHLPLLVVLLTLVSVNRSLAQTSSKTIKPIPKRPPDEVYREDVVPFVKKFCLD